MNGKQYIHNIPQIHIMLYDKNITLYINKLNL